MHGQERLWAVWLVWGMLLTGAGLVLASLRQTGERFWYWKQARRMAAGEVVSASFLRAGQRFHILAEADTADQNANVLHNKRRASANVADMSRNEFGAAMTGKIAGVTRGLLHLLLEPEAVARREFHSGAAEPNLHAGQTITIQVTGEEELFQFTASVQNFRPDGEHPGCTRLEVKLPPWLARIQRRQHVRAPIQSGVTLQTTGSEDADKLSGARVRGTLCDLSGGGLRLELDGAYSPGQVARWCEQWAEGARLECRLDTPLLRDALVNLRVCSCERIVVRGGLGIRLRGEFIQLPAWQQENIISLVFQAQRETLRQHAPRFQPAG